MCLEYFNKAIKKMNVWDMGLTKLAVAAMTLFVIAIWPAAMDWVHTINPWYFLVAGVILALKPASRIFGK